MRTSMITARIAAASLAAMTLSAAASPVEPVPRIISDEAARCIDVVRDTLVDVNTTRLHHTITRIELRGNLRAFTIQSDVYENGDVPSREVTSRCLAERWGSGTELRWQHTKT